MRLAAGPLEIEQPAGNRTDDVVKTSRAQVDSAFDNSLDRARIKPGGIPGAPFLFAEAKHGCDVQRAFRMRALLFPDRVQKCVRVRVNSLNEWNTFMFAPPPNLSI